MEWLGKIGTQLRGLWLEMSPAWRVTLSIALALCLGGVGWLAFVLMRTTYEPVLANANPEEISVAAGRLQAKGITYRLDAGGSTLSVPSDKLAAARVELAGAGLAVGKGFEVFDESPLGMTPFVQNVNFIRALQSELARSIAQMEPVAQARVHIVRPDPSPFVRDQKPTTASVVLKLKAGGKLSRGSADAIIALVSRAVEGLTPENVTVVDTRGRLLSEPRSPEDKATSSQLEYRRQLEAYLASKAEDILRQHLGTSRAVVRVTADINSQHLKEKSETFSPDGKVVVAERLVTQKSTGTPPPAKGIAGAGSNLSKAAPSPGGNGNTQSETTQTDYAVSKTSREMENRLNGITRLTVAAHGRPGCEQRGGQEAEPGRRPRPGQAGGRLQGGPRRDQGDRRGPRRPAPAPEEEAPAGAKLEDVLSIVRTGCLVLGLFLVAAVVILLWKWLAGRPAAPAAAPATPVSSREVEDFQNIARTDPERAARILAMLLGGLG